MENSIKEIFGGESPTQETLDVERETLEVWIEMIDGLASAFYFGDRKHETNQLAYQLNVSNDPIKDMEKLRNRVFASMMEELGLKMHDIKPFSDALVEEAVGIVDPVLGVLTSMEAIRHYAAIINLEEVLHMDFGMQDSQQPGMMEYKYPEEQRPEQLMYEMVLAEANSQTADYPLNLIQTRDQRERQAENYVFYDQARLMERHIEVSMGVRQTMTEAMADLTSGVTEEAQAILESVREQNLLGGLITVCASLAAYSICVRSFSSVPHNVFELMPRSFVDAIKNDPKIKTQWELAEALTFPVLGVIGKYYIGFEYIQGVNLYEFIYNSVLEQLMQRIISGEGSEKLKKTLAASMKKMAKRLPESEEKTIAQKLAISLAPKPKSKQAQSAGLERAVTPKSVINRHHGFYKLGTRKDRIAAYQKEQSESAASNPAEAAEDEAPAQKPVRTASIGEILDQFEKLQTEAAISDLEKQTVFSDKEENIIPLGQASDTLLQAAMCYFQIDAPSRTLRRRRLKVVRSANDTRMREWEYTDGENRIYIYVLTSDSGTKEVLFVEADSHGHNSNENWQLTYEKAIQICSKARES